jgi:hypothetical protein
VHVYSTTTGRLRELFHPSQTFIVLANDKYELEMESVMKCDAEAGCVRE